MPVLPSPLLSPALWARSGHLNTIIGGRLRNVRVPDYTRERIDTPDGDFLDLDWLRGGSGRLVILSHGLEGNSGRVYMSGMARRLAAQGWDVLAWNFRGCSGEQNRLLRTYHSGATEDLEAVVQRARREYDRISLVGFSLGGNLTLKYLGERGSEAPIESAAVFSAPCDLAASSMYLGRLAGRLYMGRFLHSLRQKMRGKAALFPEQIDLSGLEEMRTFGEFDDRYTAPLNGFEDAADYWKKASSKPFIGAIRVKTMIASAADDPFLPDACYPYEEARASDHVSLLVPKTGGHVGFALGGSNWWSESVAAEFLG
ncbi:MAG: putative alpha/beta-fold hydrolase [Rhodothermales bacterium]|jgi:predicted alpha/beta-fold hydrolase